MIFFPSRIKGIKGIMKNIQCTAFLTISINFSSGLQSKEIFTK